MSSQTIDVAAQDGGSFAAYLAKPAQGSGPGLVQREKVSMLTLMLLKCGRCAVTIVEFRPDAVLAASAIASATATRYDVNVIVTRKPRGMTSPSSTRAPMRFAIVWTIERPSPEPTCSLPSTR